MKETMAMAIGEMIGVSNPLVCVTSLTNVHVVRTF